VNLSFDDLHKAFESRVRLGIMSALAVNDSLDFTSLKEFLDVTDGNLATHIKKLEGEGFVESKKSLILFILVNYLSVLIIITSPSLTL